MCEYFISRRLHDGDDRRHKQKSSFLQQGIKLCDYSYFKIFSIFLKCLFKYFFYIFVHIIRIYSRVMRMHSYFIHTHIFTQTFTQSCIRACASLSQLFEFIIKMESPVLSHILKLFFSRHHIASCHLFFHSFRLIFLPRHSSLLYFILLLCPSFPDRSYIHFTSSSLHLRFTRLQSSFHNDKRKNCFITSASLSRGLRWWNTVCVSFFFMFP